MFGPNFPQSSFFDRRWAFDIEISTKYLPAAGRLREKKNKSRKGAKSQSLRMTGLSTAADWRLRQFLCVSAPSREVKP